MPPKFRWNQQSNRFIDKNGRFVSWVEIGDEIDRLTIKMRDTNRTLAESYRDGNLSLTEFRNQFLQNIKTGHLSAGTIQAGGWDNMRPTDFGRIGNVLRREYGLANNLIAGLEDGSIRPDGNFIRRVGGYSNELRVTYYAMHHFDLTDRGFDLEGSILTPADHCEECVREDDLGIRPVGEMKPLGRRICRSGCKCKLHRKNSITGEEIIL